MILWQLFWLSVFIITSVLLIVVTYGIKKDWDSAYFGIFWFFIMISYVLSLSVIISILLTSIDWTSWNAFWNSEVYP